MLTGFGTILAFVILGGILLLVAVSVGRLLRPRPQPGPADESGAAENRAPMLAGRHFPLIVALLTVVLALFLLTPLAVVVRSDAWALLSGGAVILLLAAGQYHLRRKGDLGRALLRQAPAVLAAVVGYERAWFAKRKESRDDRGEGGRSL